METKLKQTNANICEKKRWRTWKMHALS